MLMLNVLQGDIQRICPISITLLRARLPPSLNRGFCYLRKGFVVIKENHLLTETVYELLKNNNSFVTCDPTKINDKEK